MQLRLLSYLYRLLPLLLVLMSTATASFGQEPCYDVDCNYRELVATISTSPFYLAKAIRIEGTDSTAIIVAENDFIAMHVRNDAKDLSMEDYINMMSELDTIIVSYEAFSELISIGRVKRADSIDTIAEKGIETLITTCLDEWQFGFKHIARCAHDENAYLHILYLLITNNRIVFRDDFSGMILLGKKLHDGRTYPYRLE